MPVRLSTVFRAQNTLPTIQFRSLDAVQRPEKVCRRQLVSTFLSCPIASCFIDNREDARAYYRYKLAGEHPVTTRGVAIVVRFNSEEIHPFTDRRQPCATEDLVVRGGRSGEVRCFCSQRARLMDLILPTIIAPVFALQAEIPGGTKLLGPPDGSAQRLAVVVAPDQGVYFVRTLFIVSPKDFAAARRARPVPWPPT